MEFYGLCVTHTVLAVNTSSESIFTSCKMELIGRLLSLPLVNGTMQKLHMFSHPLMIEL